MEAKSISFPKSLADINFQAILDDFRPDPWINGVDVAEIKNIWVLIYIRECILG
jgi:hypothetical protein